MYLFRGSQIVAAAAWSPSPSWALLHFVIKLAGEQEHLFRGCRPAARRRDSELHARPSPQAATSRQTPCRRYPMQLDMIGALPGRRHQLQRSDPARHRRASAGASAPGDRVRNRSARRMQLGNSAGEAIRKFADRYQLSDVQNLASVLLQSEHFGASIVKAASASTADTCRQDRQSQAEEIAQRAAVPDPFPHAALHLSRHLHRSARPGSVPDLGNDDQHAATFAALRS